VRIYPAIRRKAGFIRTVQQAAPTPNSHFLNLMALSLQNANGHECNNSAIFNGLLVWILFPFAGF